ncbi:MAG TPA: HD domain-containing protein [Candidatus Saccharimonadales bacterium]|nr:HD domain-containing protein [Candidatus Saccharimonadales bacterium]
MNPISIPNWLKTLAEQFQAKGRQFYIVGGAIRDGLLEREINEWDAATDAKPAEIATILRAAGCRQIGTIGAKFGTITATFENETLEVTTFRTDQYQADSRAPAVQFGSSLLDDLERRDFTVNAIAFNPLNNALHDPFHGQTDLKAKIIRAVNEPKKRFEEDPLRMLRAIRLAVQLDFTIEKETLVAIEKEKERMGILSAERIAQEFNKILLSEKPSQGLELIVESGLISYVLPELIPSIDLEFDPGEHKDIYHHILQVLDNTPPRLELRWCALLHDIAKPLTRKKIGGEYHFLGHEVVGARLAKTILRRLKYSNEFVDYVSKLVYLHQRIPNDQGNWTDGAVRRFVRDAGEALQDLFTFAEADSTGKNERKLAKYRAGRDELKNRIEVLEKEAEIAKIKSPLSGEELMKLFHRPAGPWIKPIKEKLLALVLDGELSEKDKTKAEEIARTIVKN